MKYHLYLFFGQVYKLGTIRGNRHQQWNSNSTLMLLAVRQYPINTITVGNGSARSTVGVRPIHQAERLVVV